MRDVVPLEERLGCFGYFGFGSGYALAKWGSPDDTRELYCSRACRRSTRCWDRHRRRAREHFPDLVELAEEIARTHHGPAYMQEWLARTEQSPDKFVEPFTTMMMGNMEDGTIVANGGQPKPRGSASLVWPLTKLA